MIGVFLALASFSNNNRPRGEAFEAQQCHFKVCPCTMNLRTLGPEIVCDLENTQNVGTLSPKIQCFFQITHNLRTLSPEIVCVFQRFDNLDKALHLFKGINRTNSLL